jgi:hypothetical protein
MASFDLFRSADRPVHIICIKHDFDNYEFRGTSTYYSDYIEKNHCRGMGINRPYDTSIERSIWIPNEKIRIPPNYRLKLTAPSVTPLAAYKIGGQAAVPSARSLA